MTAVPYLLNQLCSLFHNKSSLEYGLGFLWIAYFGNEDVGLYSKFIEILGKLRLDLDVVFVGTGHGYNSQLKRRTD